MTSYVESLRAGLGEAMTRDPAVYLLGEDVLDPYGGAFKVSKGLSTICPDRVLATPISEGAITGVAAGMALRGLRPVVEIMFGDFLTLCADQIVNHIAKFRGMYDGKVSTPLVLRTPMGGGRGYGATHSQSIEKMFLGVPEIRVVAPSHFHDPGEMLQHAILDDDRPVLFIEHKLLYPMALAGTGETLQMRLADADTPYPTALVANYADGTVPDVTLIAYGGLSRLIAPFLEQMAREEINVLAALPASLKPLPIDTLASAAEASGRVVIAEEGTDGFNWGAEVSAMLNERLFGRLAAPIRRVASDSDIIPAASDAEAAMLIDAADIEDAIFEVMA